MAAVWAAIILGTASPMSAASTDTLQHLVTTNGSLTIGDKVFTNFDYFASGLTSFDPSQIRVTASFSDGVYYLAWNGNMSLVTATGSGPVSADLVLNYRVTATSGLINMIDQFYAGSVQPAGSSYLAIDETVRDTTGQVVAHSHLDGNDFGDPFAEPGDNLNIAPGQSVLDVTKDIAFGLVNGGFISVSDVRQSFHQTQVPEAATTSMLVLGLALLALVSRRRARKA